MRWAARSIVATGALAWAIGSACGGSGGGTSFPVAPRNVFPQGFLPVTLPGAGASGDVAFRQDGDLYVVSGTADVAAISRADGSTSEFAGDVGGPGTVLLAAVVGGDGRLFVADEDGVVYAIDGEGSWSLIFDTGSGPITGLAVVPAGFGDFGGSLIAAAGAAGLVRITTGESPGASSFAPGSYVDVVFSDTTLFALDAADAELDTVDSAGVATSFQGGFDTPVGLALDPTASELLVADAGDDTLHAVPVAGGPPDPRAPYVFDATPPSGIAYDGAGALAWFTSGSVVVQGSAVPRIDVDNPNFGLVFLGPTAGFGDLELARDGSFLLVANDVDDPMLPDDRVGNFLIGVPRDAAVLIRHETDIGESGELLLCLAVDPVTDTIYIGTDRGHVYRRTIEGEVSRLVAGVDCDADGATPPVALLGLELAPAAFVPFGGQLVATTEAGEICAIDPASPAPVPIVPSPILTTSGQSAPLSDLVFAQDGTLYVLDNGSTLDPGDPRILVVASDGGVTDLGANPNQLGQPDGIEIDEGGERLIVAISDDPADQLVAVSLLDASVTPLADLPLSIDDGFFPTGVVYDRLGTAVVRQGDATTRLGAFRVFP